MSDLRGDRRLLIVDDDKLFADSLAEELRRDGLDVVTRHRVSEAIALCRSTRFDVVLLDNSLPDGDGLSLTPDVLRMNDRAKIVLVTAFPSFENAVSALKSGIYDYVAKPVELDELRITVERALRAGELEQVAQVAEYRSRTESEDAVLMGSGPAFDAIRTLVAKAAVVDAPVLITGETGTGKSLVAKSLHYAAGARSKSFISVNCAALPESLVESELFGVEKGAFTGAVAARKGLFELADGGTLFLDEVGEMPLALQSKLLGVLEDRHVRRLGGEVSRAVRTRVFAATNADPEQAVADGRFRRDLFFRLNVIRIHLAPLRERREEIPTLCEFFLHRLAPGRHAEIVPEELDRLAAYDWPGNVRELRNVLDRVLVLQDGPRLEPSRLLEPVARPARTGVPSQANGAAVVPLDEVEREHILSALASLGGNLSRTAIALGISVSTLKRKLHSYGSVRAAAQPASIRRKARD